ncbi:hypothetical protein [Fulvivirga lutea]|uniref:Outer membrane protein beta-barrel domain-containing protein n=1 Tax=Fulvivirga lutea TaxID=2810512 RepID=A0A975A0W6_9BACT|nr:hypothetical protein [Fulvivirga lutea]QSE97630.1 hypothetical protein JR347_00650 [Fulvivirga lutea]
MKIYKIVLLTAATLVSSVTFGQLLERENVESRIAVGTRPEAGDFGFMLGISAQEIDEFSDSDLDTRGYPLMSFKYYLTDQLELRLNTQIYEKTKKIQGDLVNTLGQEDNIDKESFYRFMPSAQYHFSSTNLLDTYAGAGIIIGTEKNEVLTTEKTTLTGDFIADQYTKSTFVWGFNINFGVQAFIADLPLALAVEASIRGLKHSNLQYEVNSKSSVGGVVTDQTFYTLSDDAELRYQSLEYKEFELGADLRFMLSYYFRR